MREKRGYKNRKTDECRTKEDWEIYAKAHGAFIEEINDNLLYMRCGRTNKCLAELERVSK